MFWLHYNYPDDLADFDMLLETFRRDSIDDVNEQNTDDSCNMFGENKKSPRLGFGRQVKQL